MGSWGPGLYQDDEACDLKGTIALLSKMPVEGEHILEILLAHHTSPVDLTADGGPTFWLVVADQFERKGIRCARVFAQALAAIENGDDIRDLRARDMDEKDLKKRQKVLDELRQRFTHPRPQRKAPSSRLPAPVVLPGEVYAFPTMNNAGINPWSPAKELYPLNCDPNSNRWEQRGWGAMLILATGRVYDWFPWCAYASLSISPATQPTLRAAKESRLLIDHDADVGVPRAPHLRRISARLLGRFALDPARVTAQVGMRPQGYGPEFAVYAGWSLYGQSRAGPVDKGVPVAELLADG